MALAITPLLSNVITETPNAALSVTSGNFTSGNNVLLVAIILAVNDPGGDVREALTVTGGGLTWTRRIARGAISGFGYTMSLEFWTAPVVTAASMAVTVASARANNGDPCRVSIQVICLSGYDTDAPIGTEGEQDLTGNAGHSHMLGAAPASTSSVIAARGYAPPDTSNSSATPAPGWTELYDTHADGYGDLQSQYRTGSTAPLVAWADVSDEGNSLDMGVAMAIEIKAADGAPPVAQPAAMLIGV